MKLLINQEQLKSLKSTDAVPLQCYQCECTYTKPKNSVMRALSPSGIKRDGSVKKFCSQLCYNLYRHKRTKVLCANCDKEFEKNNCEIKPDSNNFCSRSCSATYNNLHKTKGTRRSKLEQWLETKLIAEYPKLKILYCDKTAVNAELDIYIPSLKLAFELNGIYHYEPIHGPDKLMQVQNNDHRKFQACLEYGIELVIIDTSTLKYFKERNCIKYLDIIKNIVDTKVGVAELESTTSCSQSTHSTN